jgi:hypothetical protein
MKSINFKALLPHFLAIATFLLVAAIFCKPALNPDLMLDQGDVTSWKGMSHQSFEYKEKYGHFPLWVSNMFSGMPAFQVAGDSKWTPLTLVDQTLQLWLPQPLNFFFLSCICFYFFGLCIGLRPFVSVIGALAFAYSTYSPIIITAGHNTKMLTLAYTPAVLGAAILIFDKKYWMGFSLLSLFTTLQLAQNHQQITYYLFFILCALSLAYIIRLLLKREYLHIGKSLGLMLLSGILALAVSAVSIIPVYDFAKESKRGGQLVINSNANQNDNIKDGKTTGLSKDYAFQWSYGKNETWTLLIPGAMGYGLHYGETEGEYELFPKLSENSRTAEAAGSLPSPELANQIFSNFQQRVYWGTQPFTNGPVYLGAIICLLFILGMFMLDNKHKWWILGVSFLSVLLAWGDNFPAFNYWIFDHFPLYNKFRAPTMALVIPQILCPALAAMLLEKIISRPEEKDWKNFMSGMTAAGAAIILAFLTYSGADFSNENETRTREFNNLLTAKTANIGDVLASKGDAYKAGRDNDLYEGVATYFSQAGLPDAQAKARELMNALQEDRQSFFQKDLTRTFILMLFAGLLLTLFMKRKINTAILLSGICLLTAYDLLDLGSNYLNKYSFERKDAFEENEFPLTAADRQILADNDPNFRVFNTRGLDEAKTSYYHKSIGGYHPAKLGIYDDLLAYQLNGRVNMPVINMLNTKYFIQQDQSGQPIATMNPDALGNCWFVNGIKWVKGPVEEMMSLNQFNPKDTVIIDESYRSIVTGAGAPDSLDKIKMTSFNNDTVRYESESKSARIAVFSEIFYKDWKAYIDGKPADIMKVNYVLRSLQIPAGKHQITFQFEPKLYILGREISFYSSLIVFLIFMTFLVRSALKKNRAEQA